MYMGGVVSGIFEAIYIYINEINSYINFLVVRSSHDHQIDRQVIGDGPWRGLILLGRNDQNEELVLGG